MTAARNKGTQGENEVLALLKPHFPKADRAKAGNESWDIVNVDDWVVEVKFRKAWHLFSWIRRIRKRAEDPGLPWVIFALHGDRRTAEGKEVGRVAIMDADLAVELMAKTRESGVQR